MANFPVPDYSTITGLGDLTQGLYINEFATDSTSHPSSPNPLWNIAGNTNGQWNLLWNYLSTNAYNYIILDNLNGQNEVAYVNQANVLAFITAGKINVPSLKVGGVVDLFYPNFYGYSPTAKGGDYGFIKYHNNQASVNHNPLKKFDTIHINANYWDFPYTLNTQLASHVTTTLSPGSLVTTYGKWIRGSTSSASLGLEINDFIKLGSLWYQVRNKTVISGAYYYQIDGLSSTYTSTGITKPYRVTEAESIHTLPLNLYYSRIQQIFTDLPLHNANPAFPFDLGLEIFIGATGVSSTGCNTVNLIREAACADLYAAQGTINTNTRILLSSLQRRPNYPNFSPLLNAVYTQGTGQCDTTDTAYGNNTSVFSTLYSDFINTDPSLGPQTFLSFGFVVSGESATLNSSCNSAVDYIESTVAGGGTPKATTDRNYSGYWFEGRSTGAGEYPLDNSLGPVASLPFETDCSDQNFGQYYTLPGLYSGYSPKTLADTWNVVTQIGEVQVPVQITPALNSETNGDTVSYLQFDTVLVLDQERLRQINLPAVGGALQVQVTSVVDAGCHTECNGSITINVTGGVAPYSFAWDYPGLDTSIDQNITGLCEGEYICTITDSDAPQTVVLTRGIQIDEESEIPVPVINSDDYCGQCNGSITAGPAPGATYLWTGPPSFTGNPASQQIDDLCAGTYNVTVTPNNGCETEFEVILPATGACYEVVSDEDTLACYGDIGGPFTLTYNTCMAPPFPLPLTYSWVGPNGFTASTNNITGIPAGVYTLTITENATGCTSTGTFTLNQPDPIIVVTHIQNPTCEGTAGIFVTSVTGGTAPYTFLWSTGAVTQNIIDIQPGEYYLTVEDSNGCIITQEFNIVTDTQEDINEIKCCLASLILKYIKLIRIGRTDKAKCILEDIKYLYLGLSAIQTGCYSDTGEDGSCTEIQEIIQRLKIICPCSDC